MIAKSETTLCVTKVSSMEGEYVEFDGHDSHIRYSPDNWIWCVGESTESVYDCKELEEAYQLWKNKHP